MPKDFRRWLITQGSIIVGTLLILAGGLWYVRSDINARIESIRSQQTQLALRLRATGTLAALKRQREEARPFEPKLQSFLPPRDRLITFSRDLERLARARGVNFGFSFGAETPATPETAGEISFTMTTGGAFESILTYLVDIEKGAFIIRLEDIELTRSGAEYALVSRGKVFFR